jgi:hypothetical protein
MAVLVLRPITAQAAIVSMGSAASSACVRRVSSATRGFAPRQRVTAPNVTKTNSANPAIAPMGFAAAMVAVRPTSPAMFQASSGAVIRSFPPGIRAPILVSVIPGSAPKACAATSINASRVIRAHYLTAKVAV